MDEMAIIDVAKFIDVVLEKTNQKKLSFIGYSMGTTLSYMLLSEKPEYNDKMNVVISIAPIAYFTPPFKPLVYSLLAFAPAVKVWALILRLLFEGSKTSRGLHIYKQKKIIKIM